MSEFRAAVSIVLSWRSNAKDSVSGPLVGIMVSVWYQWSSARDEISEQLDLLLRVELMIPSNLLIINRYILRVRCRCHQGQRAWYKCYSEFVLESHCASAWRRWISTGEEVIYAVVSLLRAPLISFVSPGS